MGGDRRSGMGDRGEAAIGRSSFRPRTPNAESRTPAASRRGSVLILAIVIAAVLAMLATAFIITARVERRAAANALRGAQAEAACRAGLAAAIYRIEATAGLYSSVDDPLKWHGYFYDAAGPYLCGDGDSWVAHYDSTFTKREMKAKKWLMPIAEGGDPAAALKRQKGFTSEYYVAVADLDGKLHSNPKFIDNSFADADRDAKTLEMVKALGLTSDPARTALANDDNHDFANWSLGHLRAKLISAGVAQAEWNDAERVFTVYPRVTAPMPLALKSVSRADSRVNVNTARKEVLKALVRNVPGFDDAKAGTVADKLAPAINRRPFANRKEMEKALVELGQSAWTKFPDASYKATDNVLTEQQMNDLLNSLAGDNSAAVDASDLDRASTPGRYSYDFDESDTTNTPPVGDHTALASDAETVAATWGTEVKFTSRFYHIYVLARTLSGDSPPRVTAERRLHAVYDADPTSRRVLWLRWNFAAKANTSDWPP